MRLVGASCLGLRLGINPTDGASLGSQLCIWWPGGKLANGALTHSPANAHMHDQTWHIALRDAPHIFIINEIQLMLSDFSWPMLTGSVFMCVCVSVTGPSMWGGWLLDSHATCSVTSYWSSNPSPTVQDRLPVRPMLPYTHLCFKQSHIIHWLAFLLILRTMIADTDLGHVCTELSPPTFSHHFGILSNPQSKLLENVCQ